VQLSPVIIATQKAETGRQIVRLPSQPIKTGIVAYVCHPRYIGIVNKRITVMAELGINARPYYKNNKNNN
jgi:hypothetical protein